MVVQAERGWFYAKKEVENIEQKFFVLGFVFEKIDFEFSFGTRILYYVSL